MAQGSCLAKRGSPSHRRVRLCRAISFDELHWGIGGPGGTCDNSPTFQRRFNVGLIGPRSSSPEGTAENRVRSLSRPFGTDRHLPDSPPILPNVETLGYIVAHPSGIRNKS